MFSRFSPQNSPQTLVGAVVVSFHPDVSMLQSQLEALSPQVSCIFVVDNGSQSECLAEVQRVLPSHAQLVTLNENRGIGAAHNEGLRRVRAAGLEYALLLDQDSVPQPEMVNRLVVQHQALLAQQIEVAAVGPVTVDHGTGTLASFVRLKPGTSRIQYLRCSGGADVLEVDFLISSGTLIPVEVLDRVGLMNEGLFIDHVDTEWCMRARHLGLRFFGVCEARLGHALGEGTVRVWVGRWRNVAIHSPLRDYYIIRNSILMIKHTPMSWGWHIVRLRYLIGYFIIFSFVLAPRFQRFRMMSLGFWHGLIGRSGRY
jgi:rhamnosyltransferase